METETIVKRGENRKAIRVGDTQNTIFMTQFYFKQESDVTQDWLFYIENEGRALAQRDEFFIYNYLDRELFNPEFRKFLKEDYITKIISQVQYDENEQFYFNLTENYQSYQIEKPYKAQFAQFKKFMKQIFQETVAEMETYQTKDIIQRVIYAYIPTFPNGFPSAILPFIIAYSAFMIKYGVKMSYPVAYHY